MLPDIFSIQTDANFVQAALQTFGYQYQHNQVYQRFCTLLGRTPDKVRQLTDIPFLPIEFFKSEAVYCGNERPTTVFTSSGTTGSQTSRHYVKDLAVYQQSFRQGFADFYGNIEEYTVLALLPSYLERTGSSLITMVADLIERSGSADSGFYLNEYDLLAEKLTSLDRSGRKVLLIGVSFALLDLVETHRFQLKNTIVMETGGMKGRRKELIREELHAILCEGFGVEHIHSEYGMTELLSQAYSAGSGLYESVRWLKVLIRDTNDALSYQRPLKTGGINLIDLANIHSCSFIATQDLGRLHPDGRFEVLGRFDNADIRGCNLLIG
ncbi:acyl transferase [Capnocytophaga leadbetteri]|uniref:LuxE/PaaK family acyltransferase n=1 Tax=Capnocytophaga leadbetteri TaxID=327575 RepID=UPI00288999D7|nr:acyl transferase [Capnocytophaga leadbetteri]